MNETEAVGPIQSRKQFPDTPRGNKQRWHVEIKQARKSLQKFCDDGKKVVERFLDLGRDEGDRCTHVNLFTANVQTLRALLYGKVPAADVKRRWGDPNDAVGRATGEMLRRLLNTDIEYESDGYAKALRNALLDRLLPGSGWVRLRYVADFTEAKKVPAKTRTDEETGEEVEVAEAYEEPPTKTYECVEIDHVNWEDVLWSPARTWDEVRWVAFKAPMTREALKKRFGAVGGKVPLETSDATAKGYGGDELLGKDPWARAEVWEIWSKEDHKVYWWVEGYPETLDEQDDPLGLDCFWPCPMPMMANLTTSAMIPRSDYALAQDLYDEVDTLSTRITLLERAIRVVGVYNANCGPLQRMLAEANQNEMIPADEWAMFAEKGGIKGNIDWFPLEMVVVALDKLREVRTELIGLLYQVTGMSDIMRGQSSANTTATEQAIKAKFASVRIQDFQDEFARFASDTLRIKSEIIAKMYADETVIQRSNILFTADAPLAPQAVQLLRDQFLCYRVEVKPESVSATDYAALKQERIEILTALSQYMKVIQEVGASAPPMIPHLLELMKWAFVGFKGGATAEAIIDNMVVDVRKLVEQMMQTPPGSDPKAEADKFVAQAKIEQTKIDAQAHQQKTQLDMQKSQSEHQMSMQKMERQMQMDAMRSLDGVAGGAPSQPERKS